MKPPYQITEKILQLIVQISEKIGEINAVHLSKPPTELRKKNRIKTIQSSLEIEGNTLTEEQITALLNNKRVIAPQKDILEVQNAIKIYDRIGNLNPNQINDLKDAHRVLMEGLVDRPGQFRTKNVGIVKGSKVAHLAPSGTMIGGLMNDLFDYLKNDNDIILIKSCVFHYEFEFIHPFIDGNGRMGRLWQTVILMQQYSVFEYLSIEKLIKENQSTYYNSLAQSDKIGESTPFIAFMLGLILQALDDLLKTQNVNLTVEERVQLYKDKIGFSQFSRKDYLTSFKEISSATASRDLKWATEQGILIKTGTQNTTKYQFSQ